MFNFALEDTIYLRDSDDFIIHCIYIVIILLFLRISYQFMSVLLLSQKYIVEVRWANKGELRR